VSEVSPVRHLGRLRLVAVGLNSVIGGGIFILPATVTALVGGAGLAGYLAAGAVVTGVGLALGYLAARHDASGGPYLYVREAFGPFAGFQVGWLFCLARLTAMANLMNGFAQYLGALAPGAARPLARAGFVLLCAAAIVTTNIVGIRATSRAANILAVVKVAPLVLLGLAGLFFLRPGAFALATVRPSAMLRSVLLLIFAFTGFEILTVPAEESHRPRRDMPFALAATIGIVCALYLLVHAVSLGVLPDLGAEPAPLAAAAGVIAGPGGRYGMTLVAALSMAGCALLALVGGSRMLYAMSARRQIPAFLGALHPGFRTPLNASLLLGSIATALAIGGGYAELAAVSAGARMLVYLACCLACLRLPAAGAATRGRAVPLLTAAAIAALLPGLERREVVAGMIGILIGPALYLAARRERRVLLPKEEGP
jgi:APA family basic amino acid/polyamine antiporter